MDNFTLVEARDESPDEELSSTKTEQALLHHPHIVLRLAALSFDTTKALNSKGARDQLDSIQALEVLQSDAAQVACDLLEPVIGIDELDQDKRRQLLKAKRNLFNGKTSKLDCDGWVADEFAPVAKAVRTADNAITGLTDAREAFETIFTSSNEQLSQALREACRKEPDFLKAVAFSAPKVVADLEAAAANPKKFTGKRGRNLDSALFNYFTRATVKVSPLSFFTPIRVGQWTDETDQHPVVDGLPIVGVSEVSRRALDHVLATLARSLAFWGQSHPLMLNPTAEAADGHIDFKEMYAKGGSSGRTWGVYQPQQRLALNPRLFALVEHLKMAEKQGQTLQELFAALKGEPFPDDPNQFAGYIANAMRVGLIVPSIPVFEQEDVPAYLSKVLAQRIPDAAAILDRLVSETEAYGAASHTERGEASKSIHAAYGELCNAINAEIPNDPKSPLFYEDCQISGETTAVSTDYVGTALNDLHRYADLLPLLDYNHIVQAVSAALFRQRYGDDARVVAVDCVESIADEAQEIATRMTVLPLEEQEKQLAEICPTAAKLLEGKRIFFAEIQRRMEAGKDIVLDDAFVDRMLAYIPEVVRKRSTSYTVIGQTDDGGATGKRFVLNRWYSGHSMLMSRFLRHQSDDEIGEVRSYLDRLAGSGRPVEIPGVFGFNANIHPRFVDAELEIPGRRANYGSTEKVSVSTMEVGYDPELDRLAFYDAQGGKLSAMYFGFLNMMVLPNLYQVLGRMNLQGLVLDLWQDLLFAGLLNTSELTLLPRVSFGESVISRRSWFSPARDLPDPQLDEAEYFKQMHAFFARLGDRKDYFVRLVALRDDFFGSGDDDEVAMADTTDFKPAYLSLDMPMTVASLRRRLRRRPRALLFQEVLPEIGTGGQEWNGAAHACEVQFEISREEG
ncbi:MAG: lantibiotic dehydratase [Pseudomonadota bacterium]